MLNTSLKLKGKIVFGVLTVILTVVLSSIVAVFFLTEHQNRNAAHETLGRSLNILRSEIQNRLSEQATDMRQMIQLNDVGSNINFIMDYLDDRSVSLEGYQTMTTMLATTSFNSGLWHAALYDPEGNLMAFAVNMGDNQYQVGHYYYQPAPLFTLSDLNEDGKLDLSQRREAKAFPELRLPVKFEAPLPESEGKRLEKFDNGIYLSTYSPVYSESFNPDTKEMEKKQVGLVYAISAIDANFATAMATLSGTQINVFAGTDLSVGSLPAYRKFETKALPAANKKWTIEGQSIIQTDLKTEQSDYFQGILPIYRDARSIGAFTALQQKSVARQNTWQSLITLAGVYMVCLLLILPMVMFAAAILIKPIRHALASLTSAAQKVNEASDQVAMTSQTLAAGASEQAASLEETTASLEEIASMTRQNADNSSQANELMQNQANPNFEKMNQLMKAKKEVIGKAVESSEKTANIIKTIDEIAFQTNLLALNAAVEAARAGEAGAGFAVVADEVRSLALRAASAAKETSDLIRSSNDQIKRASDLNDEVMAAMDKTMTVTRNVSQAIDEIAQASKEQSEGISQLNDTVNNMDRVTQQNAASAEESASTSEELSGEADQMAAVVQELGAIIGGKQKSSQIEPGAGSAMVPVNREG